MYDADMTGLGLVLGLGPCFRVTFSDGSLLFKSNLSMSKCKYIVFK